MTKLKFMAEPPMDPTLMTCLHCGEEERIGVHQKSERRYKCHECGKTFAEIRIGVVYNFCTVHTSLAGTPAMAADLTDHVWSVRELLSLGGPLKSLHGVL